MRKMRSRLAEHDVRFLGVQIVQLLNCREVGMYKRQQLAVPSLANFQRMLLLAIQSSMHLDRQSCQLACVRAICLCSRCCLASGSQCVFICPCLAADLMLQGS